MMVYNFVQVFEWRSRNDFLEKQLYLQNCLNVKFFIRHFVENGFKAALRSKVNLLSVWKLYFPIICNIFCYEIETIFWETNSDPSKLFQSKYVHGNHFRKWFYATFMSKTNVLSLWKWRSFPNFWVTKSKPFSGKAKQSLFKLRFCTRDHFR